MPRWSQTEDYRESTGDEPVEQEDAFDGGASEDSPKKHNRAIWVLLALIGVAVAVGGIILAVVLSKGANSGDSSGSGDDLSSILDGDSSDPFGDDFDDILSGVTLFSYTPEEVEALRAAGYTGDEIEQNQTQEVPAATLIQQAEDAHNAWVESLSNPDSPEYQELISTTTLGQPALNIPTGLTEDEINAGLTSMTDTDNLDYDKVPARGSNLYLRIHMPDGSYHFMNCPFARYCSMPDSGNIVVTYTVITYQDCSVITNMVEERVAK